MSKTVETGLAISSAKLGKSLLQMAAEANEDAQRKQVIDKVQNILMRVRKQEEYRDNANSNIALLKKQVAALENGKFSISIYGQLSFHDEALNKADLIKMKECTNCGYPQTR